MCNYSDYVEQKGIEKGIEKGRIETLSESVVKLVRDGNYNMETALNLLHGYLTISVQLSKQRLKRF